MQGTGIGITDGVSALDSSTDQTSTPYQSSGEGSVDARSVVAEGKVFLFTVEECFTQCEATGVLWDNWIGSRRKSIVRYCSQ
jgi:hypothetical protein